MAISIKMPQLGESVTEGTIGKWLKSPGDKIEKYEPLLEVITDKVDTKVTSIETGTLLSIEVSEGETVPVGTVLAYVDAAGERPSNGDMSAETVAATDLESTPTETPARRRISPVVARLIAEHDVDISHIEGSGRGGRVTKNDVLAYIEAGEQREEETAAEAPPPVIVLEPTTAESQRSPTPTNRDELVKLTPMRRAIADHMVRSIQTSPHVTTVFEVDLSAVVAHRRRHKDFYAGQGLRLTYTAYIVETVARALQYHPYVNASFTDDGILLKADINIGVAVAMDGGEGLIVPVIKHADNLNLKGIVQALNGIIDRARSRQLAPDAVQNGTFTLTNYGVAGSLIGTPIINQPQSAILGLGAIQKRTVVVESDAGDSITIRPMCYLTLTFDHRVLDGAGGDAFMCDLVRLLETYPAR